MQKLKVYLSKQNRGAIQKIKFNILKNKQQLQSSNERSIKTHNNSLAQLGKSNVTRNHSNSNTHNGNQNANTNTNTRKRNHSNLQNSTQEQISDFRAEIQQVVRKSNRYDNLVENHKKDNTHNTNHNSNNNRLNQDNRKNSKQVASDTRLNYKTQPANELEKISKRYHRSQRNLQQIIYKRNNLKHNLSDISVEFSTNINNKPTVKQEVQKSLNKSQNRQKFPSKKRSKSAHPNNKPEGNEQPKQVRKRSSSAKKPSKNIVQLQHKKHQKTQNSKPPLNCQIQFKSMFRTRKGVQIMNPNKVNQDRFFIKQHFQVPHSHSSSPSFLNIYAVADGHGPLGHCVSHLIVQNFQKKFQSNLHQTIPKQKAPTSMPIQHSLQKTFHDLQHILNKNLQFNADFSGSTLVSIVVENNRKIVCGNVGDSRAIVARQLNRSNWEIIRLSNDHKPQVEDERARILKQGGRIETVYDENGKSIGPLRVWLPKKQLQGLAMSRSLGDNISKPIGVTHHPEILTHQLTKQDKFILLASDGVWQFLSNYQILSLIIPYYRQNRLEDACEALMKQAYRSWTIQDNSVVDDITFILIFLGEGNLARSQGMNKERQKENGKEKEKEKQKQMDQKEKIEKKVQNQNNSIEKTQNKGSQLEKGQE